MSADADLAAQLARAQEAIRARDDFLAIAAHELRSPMNALALQMAALERIADMSGSDGRVREYIQRARIQLQRYVRRATLLLDVSRLNAGQLHPNRRAVPLREVVQAVVDDHRDEAAFHRVALQIEVDGDDVGWWDRDMVEQMLSNLVSNAFKYGAGTPVTVRAGVEAGTGIACFTVADGGPGIAEAQRQRIFEKFERVVSRDTHRSGFGLGLWIVAQLAAIHGGTVDVTSPPEGGARFTIRLPLRAGQASQEEENPT